jgi:2-polyprenyl-3-methyl-5-hydroxy-6-metoxy-1,4-benzoquinol methylase
VRTPPPNTSTSSSELLERLNAWWRIGGPEPAWPSLKQRLGRPVKRILARMLRPQEAFNATLVDYINTVVRPLETEQQELRTSIGVLHQAVHGLTRGGDRLRPDRQPDVTPPLEGPSAQASPDALSHKYLGFEDRFRGSEEAIRAAQADYVPLFTGTTDVLDVGCGRGELLTLLREAGVSARGIDLNGSMVHACRDKGLDALQADALAYLRAQPDGSLGGLVAAQVVEHLEPAYLTHLLDVAFAKLRPGAPIVLETINPACWFAFFESYIRDITHVRPLHPDTLRFLLVATGFERLEIRYRAPFPDDQKLRPIPASAALRDSIEALNANVARLNGLLFTYMDYAAIGWRP